MVKELANNAAFRLEISCVGQFFKAELFEKSNSEKKSSKS